MLIDTSYNIWLSFGSGYLVKLFPNATVAKIWAVNNDATAHLTNTPMHFDTNGDILMATGRGESDATTGYKKAKILRFNTTTEVWTTIMSPAMLPEPGLCCGTFWPIINVPSGFAVDLVRGYAYITWAQTITWPIRYNLNGTGSYTNCSLTNTPLGMTGIPNYYAPSNWLYLNSAAGELYSTLPQTKDAVSSVNGTWKWSAGCTATPTKLADTYNQQSAYGIREKSGSLYFATGSLDKFTVWSPSAKTNPLPSSLDGISDFALGSSGPPYNTFYTLNLADGLISKLVADRTLLPKKMKEYVTNGTVAGAKSIAYDVTTGDLYLATLTTISKLNFGTGVVTSFSTGYDRISQIRVSPAGTLFVADQYSIKKVSSGGVATTIKSGYTIDNGLSDVTVKPDWGIFSVAADASDNVYFTTVGFVQYEGSPDRVTYNLSYSGGAHQVDVKLIKLTTGTWAETVIATARANWSALIDLQLAYPDATPNAYAYYTSSFLGLGEDKLLATPWFQFGSYDMDIGVSSPLSGGSVTISEFGHKDYYYYYPVIPYGPSIWANGATGLYQFCA